MGLEYAWVHVYYTIPPAVLLTGLYSSLFRLLDAYKLAFLILVAVVSTIPWDSYLIKERIWGYPPEAVLGITFWHIPLEELFFFVVQTYTTSFLYFILSKPTFHATYLRGPSDDLCLKPVRRIGAVAIVVAIAGVGTWAQFDRRATYLNLIFVWSGPFLLLLWLLAYQLLISLPWSNTFLPIALPTLYLWIVDTLALRRGTWVINSGTKLGLELWPGLEIEEAMFFLVTNSLIVFGHVAFDNALAVLDISRSPLGDCGTCPSPIRLIEALLLPVTLYDERYLYGLGEAFSRLRQKSRSFYTASGLFPRKLRRDLILLYSFCRATDDLVDEEPSAEAGREIIDQLRKFLDYAYERCNPPSEREQAEKIVQSFPASTQLALELLPTKRLPAKPLYDLMSGFSTDTRFMNGSHEFPIINEHTLDQYARHVAGTVSEMCIELIFQHGWSPSTLVRDEIVQAGRIMGVALQYINIARDIRVDASIGRVYLPTTWLKEVGLSPQAFIEEPDRPEIESLRAKLLDLAFVHYHFARPKIDLLPSDVRGPVLVMIENYIEIGRTLRQRGYRVEDGRSTVGKVRRLWISWKALNSI